MVIASKARALSFRDKGSLAPIGLDIISKARCAAMGISSSDPLCAWFVPSSAVYVRRIEQAIQRLLINHVEFNEKVSPHTVNAMSDLAAFYYTALFRTVRPFLERFVASNPTWMKRPSNHRKRIRPKGDVVFEHFKMNVEAMVAEMGKPELNDGTASVRLTTASSVQLPLDDSSVDLVLTSPPYCTRIDYAVATMAELSVLGYDFDDDLPELRRSLLGTSTVPAVAPEPTADWGVTCTSFLESLWKHPSKASRTYYWKNHTQYFGTLYQSLGEIARVCRRRATCVLVVQDSYYKNIHNDLPQISKEMVENLGLSLIHRQDFSSAAGMGNVNPRVRVYRSSTTATESVLVFRKQ